MRAGLRGVLLLLIVACNPNTPSPSQVASVKVLPNKAQINIFTSITYTLEVRDPTGNLLENLPATWASSETMVATFADSSKPTALGVGLGKTEIRATVGGKTSEPAELEVVAQGGGGSCNFARARWVGPVRHTIVANRPNEGTGTLVVEGNVTFESSTTACLLELREGKVSISGTLQLPKGCTMTYNGSGVVKPPDGNINLENRPRDTPPRVKYSGGGLSILETTITINCPDPNGNSTTKGPLGYQWLLVPPNPEYFTDPNLSSFSGTYTLPNSSGGTNTFEWNLVKQPLTP